MSYFDEVEQPTRFDRLKAKLRQEKPNLNHVMSEFKNWSNSDQYLIFRKTNKYTHKNKYKAVKAAKRGNDVYSWRLWKRLEKLRKLPQIIFFNPKNRNKRQKTRVLFLTLTYRREKRLDKAWQEVGTDFNRYLSGLKRRYGKIDILRCWEAQQDGYPHIHCVLLFHECEFETFFYNKKWRIAEKDDLVRNWHWGFSDVFALYSLGAGVGYVMKYVTKMHNALRDEKPKRGLVLSLALMWVFKKRAFSVTKGFGLFLVKKIDNRPYGQIDIIEGETIYEWTLVGFMTNDGRFTKWSVDLSYLEFWDIHGSDDFTLNKCLVNR